MTKTDIKQRFKELMEQNPPQAEIETLFEKAVECGALDLENEPPEDYRLAKIIYHSILYTMAQEWQPLMSENKQEADNLKLFFRKYYKNNTTMKVTDLNGFELEVTDLDEAIRQSEAFVAYSQVGDGFSEFNKKQRAYWSDLHHKLLILKSKQDNE